MRPTRPPAELRSLVLAAARAAAGEAAPPFLAALYRDRWLRLLAASLSALALANALAAGSGARGVIAAAPAQAIDGTAVPADPGLTAAEQLDALAPVLGDALPRRQG